MKRTRTGEKLVRTNHMHFFQKTPDLDCSRPSAPRKKSKAHRNNFCGVCGRCSETWGKSVVLIMRHFAFGELQLSNGWAFGPIKTHKNRAYRALYVAPIIGSFSQLFFKKNPKVFWSWTVFCFHRNQFLCVLGDSKIQTPKISLSFFHYRKQEGCRHCWLW